MNTIKINICSLFLCFYFTCLIPSMRLNAQQKPIENTGIVFNNQEFKEVLATARASHKKIFVDAYATWCAPCRLLQKTTFRDVKAAAYFNKNFINVSIDVEKAEGPELVKKWQVDGLPTLLILDEQGNVLESHTGYVDGPGLLEFAKEASGK